MDIKKLVKSLIVKNPQNINWMSLSQNKSIQAIEILKQHPQNIDWPKLVCNPAIFDQYINPTTMQKSFEKATKRNYPNMKFQNTKNINSFLGGKIKRKKRTCKRKTYYKKHVKRKI